MIVKTKAKRFENEIINDYDLKEHWNRNYLLKMLSMINLMKKSVITLLTMMIKQ